MKIIDGIKTYFGRHDTAMCRLMTPLSPKALARIDGHLAEDSRNLFRRVESGHLSPQIFSADPVALSMAIARYEELSWMDKDHEMIRNFIQSVKSGSSPQDNPHLFLANAQSPTVRQYLLDSKLVAIPGLSELAMSNRPALYGKHYDDIAKKAAIKIGFPDRRIFDLPDKPFIMRLKYSHSHQVREYFQMANALEFTDIR